MGSSYEPGKEDKEGRNAGRSPEKQRFDGTASRHLLGERVLPRRMLNLKSFLFFSLPHFRISDERSEKMVASGEFLQPVIIPKFPAS
jgi:hypothetical protein